MNTTAENNLRVIEDHVRALAARLADIRERFDDYTDAICSGVPGTVVERDPVWRNLREQVDETARDYLQLQARARSLRHEAQR